MIRRKKRGKTLLSLLAPLLILAVLLCFFTALNNISRDQGSEGRAQLENALRRAAVACYAAEGIYPPDLDYLAEHYGIQVEEESYIVFYEIFADNLMPNITVLEKGA